MGRAPPRCAPRRDRCRSVGAGEALSLGATDAVGDLHVGLQTVVDVVDWYGRDQPDLLLCCLGHEGGAFVYRRHGAPRPGRSCAPAPLRSRRAPARLGRRHPELRRQAARRRPQPERAPRPPGVPRQRILWHREAGRGASGARRFAPPQPLLAGGRPFDVGARSQMVCPVDLGDGRVSLIVGTNDWSAYWPSDVGAWEDTPGYRPYDADGTWRGGPMRGRLYLLRQAGPRREPAHPATAPPPFAPPVELCHEDGTPLEVYGLTAPAAAAPGGGGRRLRPRRRRLPRPPVVLPQPRAATARTAHRASTRARRCAAPARSSRRSTASPPRAATPGRLPADRAPGGRAGAADVHARRDRRPLAGRRDRPAGERRGRLRPRPAPGPAHRRRGAGGGPPQRLQAFGAPLSVGAKACPTVVDWDGDGRDDLVHRQRRRPGAAHDHRTPRRPPPTRRTSRIRQGAALRRPDRPSRAGAAPAVADGRCHRAPCRAPARSSGATSIPAVGAWPAGSPDRSTGSRGRRPACPHVARASTPCTLGRNTRFSSRLRPARVARSRRRPGTQRQPASRPAIAPGRRLHVPGEAAGSPCSPAGAPARSSSTGGTGACYYLQVGEDGELTRYRILPDGPAAEHGEAHVARRRTPDADDEARRCSSTRTSGAHRSPQAGRRDWDGDGLPDLLVGRLRDAARRRPTPTASPPSGCCVTPGPPAGRASPALSSSPSTRAGRPASADTPASLRPGTSTQRPGSRLTGPPARANDGAARPDLLVGSENGRVYAFRRSYIDGKATVDARLERGSAGAPGLPAAEGPHDARAVKQR